MNRGRNMKPFRFTVVGGCMLAFAIVGATAQVAPTAASVPAAAASSGTITRLDEVIYGRVLGAGLLADIAYPEAATPLPVIISVHGGRWKAGHKRDRSSINVEQWAALGFFAMSIDYRLVDCTPAPACYQDLQCAIRYVHAHADHYKIDASRIFLIGQSAGGHLVSLASTLGEGPWPRTGGWEKASNDFRGAISVAACYDLPSLAWGSLWTPLKQDPLEARRLASPVNHVRRDAKPLLILHSDDDKSVPIANVLPMIAALEKAGADFTFHRYADQGHMGITDLVVTKSLEFIRAKSR
jgi:acetyl esterase/lipase